MLSGGWKLLHDLFFNIFLFKKEKERIKTALSKSRNYTVFECVLLHSHVGNISTRSPPISLNTLKEVFFFLLGNSNRKRLRKPQLMIVEGLKSRRFVGFVVGSFDLCITSLSVRGRKEKKRKETAGWMRNWSSGGVGRWRLGWLLYAALEERPQGH